MVGKRKRRGDVIVRDLIQMAVESGEKKRGRVVGAGMYVADGDQVVVCMGGEMKRISCSGNVKSAIEKEFFQFPILWDEDCNNSDLPAELTL
jgi:hypothetical protein